MKTEKRPLLLIAPEAEAFYYGDVLIEQDSKIDRFRLLSLSEVFDFSKDELVVEKCSERDARVVTLSYRFPERLSDLWDQYY